MRTLLAAVLDVCGVLVFVVIGRASHAEANALAGLAVTAWPFLAALAVGWLVTRAWRRPTAVLPTGVGVWLVTVGLGMVLRVLAGQGTALTFIMVSLVFLGLVLPGRRALARVVPSVRRAA